MPTITQYSDVNLSYKDENRKRLDRDVDKSVTTEVNAIVNSLDNLFSISPGEALFEPEKGLDAESFLFEIMDSQSEFALLSYFYNEINIQEPRVSLIISKSSIVPNYDQHEFACNLVFEVSNSKGLLLEYKNILTK